jgi:tetratricopeptide (TPR) repeat protein
MMNKLLPFGLLVILFVLTSCSTPEGGSVVYSGQDSETPEPAEAEVVQYGDPFIRQRILADMLYEARLAFEDNRLMSPPGDNAFDRYREVLDIEPDNEVALQGVRDIVSRYVALADAAIKVGQYDNAENYLNRAGRIGENGDLIEDARHRLAQARDTKMDVFALDAESLDDRSLDIMVELGEIGQMIRDREATFLINARSDEEGRWIYKIMREAVGGYRLRGNIAVDNEPSIQVLVPKS